ncbi:MAG: M1 family metallopeptidase [Acidimicrobiales bacterium]
MTTDDRYRLPRTAVPSRYELELAPDLDAASFDGRSTVALDLNQPLAEIVLNALELDIDEAWLTTADGDRVDASVTLEPETERVRLALAREVAAGPASLHTRFRGTLNDKLTGFYRSTFTDQSGTEQLIAATQFEATFARKAFPSWDEPSFKATFAVSLVVPDDLLALSNGAEVERTPTGDGRVQVRFAETMKMSTYLVAFVVGPFDITDPVDVDGTPLRVATPRGKLHLADHALDAGAAALRYFADYYGIPYPGDKVDLIAIPDFAFGAMENLGAITFREIALLLDPGQATQPELQRVTDVITHELAHMWFGDLVTMKWWNGIWLNEAFATFMEMKATDDYRPEWQRWTSFALERTPAFDTDATASTRPVEYEVVSPAEAEGMFDVLTYQKGAAVLRMLEQYLGEEVMRDGIRHYLARHAYGNTDTADLWNAIEEVSGQPVRRIMDSWILQGGYPVIGVELVGDGTTLRLVQERFRFEGGEDAAAGEGAAPEGLGERWVVPVVVRYGSNGQTRIQRVLVDSVETGLQLDFAPEWVIANADGNGFYRTRYTPKLLSALASRGGEVLSPIERYGLVDDTYASVLAGTTSAPDFLDFARSFTDETELEVWQRLAAALGALGRIVDEATRPRFQATVRGLAGPALNGMGWTPAHDEDGRTRELRGVLFELLGVLGADVEVRSRAATLHAVFEADRDSVDPALAAAAVAVLAESATGDEAAERFEQFWQRHRQPATPQEEVRYLFALARFHDDALFRRILDLSLTEVRSQNGAFLIRLALMNRTHGPVAWDFVAEHWTELNRRLPSNSIARMVEGIVALSDPEVANRVQAFFREHEVPQGAKTVAQHLERQRVNVALREREAQGLKDALT